MPLPAPVESNFFLRLNFRIKVWPGLFGIGVAFQLVLVDKNGYIFVRAGPGGTLLRENTPH